MTPRPAGAVAACLLLVANADAATWHVTPDGLGDAPTIQAAIDSAAAGDTVSVACGTYFESGINMKDGVRVASETGQPSCVTIDAQGADRVFRCSGIDALASIVGFTVTGGSSGLGGGILCQAGSFPRIEDCEISGNVAYDGAGLYCVHSSPTLRNCLVRDNTALASGGGMKCYDSSHPVVEGCTFSSNTADGFGGAISCFFFSSPGLTDCTIVGNSAGSGGGALDAITSLLTLTGCVVTGNSSSGRGGAFDFVDSSPLITGCTIAANHAAANGGGVHVEGSDVDVTNTILWGNCATGGAALHLADAAATATLTCCDVDTSAGGVGGVGNVVWSGLNLSVDPLFCAPAACAEAPTDLGAFGLQDASPCFDAGGSCGAVIGALGVNSACPTVSVAGGRPSPSDGPLAVRSFPTPFRGSTRIVFDLPGGQAVTLRVYDAAGRLVRTLEEGRVRGAGPQAIPWDGRDRAGAAVAAGVYFFRLDAGARRGVHRTVRLP